jgi:hypothetical protein
MADSILDRWDITPEELTELVDKNPSLRGMILGYLAELKLEKLWLSGGEISDISKHDDHDRKKKGDRVIKYKGVGVGCISMHPPCVISCQSSAPHGPHGGPYAWVPESRPPRLKPLSLPTNRWATH